MTVAIQDLFTETISIYATTHTRDAAGGQVPAFSLKYANLKARHEEASGLTWNVPPELGGAPTMTHEHKFFLFSPGDIAASDVVLDETAQRLRITDISTRRAIRNMPEFIVITCRETFGVTTTVTAFTNTVTTSGTWTAPSNLLGGAVTVSIIGNGGNGQVGQINATAEGGGGGAYSSADVSVTAGSSYVVDFAANYGSHAGVMFTGDGGDFVFAADADGQAGGRDSECVGTTKYNGGSGSLAGSTPSGSGTRGGGGGGAAGPSGDGTSPPNSIGGASGGSPGGAGGDGGELVDGAVGSNYGGGGGGGGWDGIFGVTNGGAGAPGVIKISGNTWT